VQAGKPSAAEGEAERGRGNDRGPDARIMDPRSSGNVRAQTGIYAGMLQGRTQIMIRVCLAIRSDLRKIRDPARGHEHGEAAVGKTECADAGRIQPPMPAPLVEHVVNQPVKLLGTVPRLQDLALVIESVAGVTDRRDHEARMSQGEGRVVMAAVPPCAAVRHHHERQAIARDRSIRRHGLADIAQGVRRRRRVSRIPDAGGQRRLRAIRYPDLLKTDIGGENRRGNQGNEDGDRGHQSHGGFLRCRPDFTVSVRFVDAAVFTER
jgi:hypothetical protein